MSRLWMISIVVACLLLATVGCKPPAPPVAPEPEMEVEKTPEVAPPPTPPVEADPVEKPWFEDLDLRALNAEAERRGFQPTIHFDLDKSDLKPEAREKLTTNAEFLRANREIVATLEGHCDERGTDEYNLALGDRRANSGRDYLTSLGVDGSRLQTISYGEERPVCTESDESCWFRNRRVYFVLRLAS